MTVAVAGRQTSRVYWPDILSNATRASAGGSLVQLGLIPSVFDLGNHLVDAMSKTDSAHHQSGIYIGKNTPNGFRPRHCGNDRSFGNAHNEGVITEEKQALPGILL